MLKSYKWDGMGWDWDWIGRKSLKGVILRAPLCGAKKISYMETYTSLITYIFVFSNL